MIIVPYNFSKQSLFAFEEACNLARLSKSEIALIHVVERNPLFEKLDKKIIQQALKGFNVDLKEVVESQKEKNVGIKITTHVRKGRICSEILKASKELKAKWIVVGLNSKKDINEKEYIGANTFRILKYSNIPVITVSSNINHTNYKNILLPIDSTDETVQKVKEAIEIGKLFNSTIHVVSFQEKNSLLKYRVQIKAKQVCEKITKAGVLCQTKIIFLKNNKEFVDELFEYSTLNNINLVITMAENELGVKPFFVNLRTQKLMRKFKIPVMTQKPKLLNHLSIK